MFLSHPTRKWNIRTCTFRILMQDENKFSIPCHYSAVLLHCFRSLEWMFGHNHFVRNTTSFIWARTFPVNRLSSGPLPPQSYISSVGFDGSIWWHNRNTRLRHQIVLRRKFHHMVGSHGMVSYNISTNETHVPYYKQHKHEHSLKYTMA